MWCGECYTLDPEVFFSCQAKRELLSVMGLQLETNNDYNELGDQRIGHWTNMVGRNGDHILIPFECDLCIFRKMQNYEPVATYEADKLLLGCIRRISLDGFLSRATSTVLGNRNKVGQGLALSKLAGLDGPYEHYGSMLERDSFGYQITVQTVLASRRSGKICGRPYAMGLLPKIQDSLLKSSQGIYTSQQNPMILGDDKGKAQQFLQDGCTSCWYSRFSIGCKNRMGQAWSPNQAMSTALIIAFLDLVKFKIKDSGSLSDLNCGVFLGAYTVITDLVSLCGSEGFLLDLGGLKLHAPDRSKTCDYFLIPLMGKVKGEHHNRCHLLPRTFLTASGIQPYGWIDDVIKLKLKQGLTDGPAISDEQGRALNSSTIDQGMHEVLEEFFISQRDLFQRSSDTRALNQSVSREDIDLVNRWHQIEKADGSRPSLDMRYHYAQIDLLVEPFL
jgi:hypothetical protein